MKEEIIEKLLRIKNERYMKDVTLGNLNRAFKWYVEHEHMNEEDALDATIKFMFENAWCR